MGHVQRNPYSLENTQGVCKAKFMTNRPNSPHRDFDPAWVTWLGGTPRAGSCPACGATGPMAERVSVRNPFRSDPDVGGSRGWAAFFSLTWNFSGKPVQERGPERIVYVECFGCGSLVSPNFEIPDYRDEDRGGAALKFAKEQGAGIAVMLRPLYWIDHKPITKFLDVGGGYGFALDAARTLFGWTVQGADPATFARIGARELDLEIDDIYISEAEPARGAPFDLVLASEVIEHVGDPIGFARALGACAGPSGRVLLTTPDAEKIHPGADMSVALMGLAPGSHVMVFSRDGLERVLRAAGFSHIQIVSRDNSLIAAAGKTAFDFDPSADVPRDDYATYLRTRAEQLPEHSDLRCGFLGRLARADADAQRWDAVRADLEALGALLKARYRIDLDAPQRWSAPAAPRFRDFAKAAPFNLGIIFFVLGMERLNVRGDRKGARAAFEAARRACEAARASLQNVGADDLEQGVIAEHAKMLALRCRVWEEPEMAAGEVAADWDNEIGSEEDRVETLMNLVIAGATQSGPALERAVARAEAWLHPVAMGARPAASSSEREALDALARRYEARGEPRAARPWRLAALLEARDPVRMLALRGELEALDRRIELEAARADREAVLAAAACDRHASASAAAGRMIARGPSQPGLNAAEQVALVLHCLSFRNEAQTALSFLDGIGDEVEAETVEALRAEALRRSQVPDAEQAYLTGLAASGRWAEMDRYLSAHPHADAAGTSPELAFALAMFYLNERGDAQSALDFFQRASEAGHNDLGAAAHAHVPECLARLRRPAEAEEAARALLVRIESEGQSALSRYAEKLSTYLSGGVVSASPGTADRPS